MSDVARLPREDGYEDKDALALLDVRLNDDAEVADMTERADRLAYSASRTGQVDADACAPFTGQRGLGFGQPATGTYRVGGHDGASPDVWAENTQILLPPSILGQYQRDQQEHLSQDELEHEPLLGQTDHNYPTPQKGGCSSSGRIGVGEESSSSADNGKRGIPSNRKPSTKCRARNKHLIAGRFCTRTSRLRSVQEDPPPWGLILSAVLLGLLARVLVVTFHDRLIEWEEALQTVEDEMFPSLGL